MALAHFFAKNVLAASSVLPDVTYESFATALEAQRIGVYVSDGAMTREGRVLVHLLVNLLARLYPRLVLLGSDNACAELAAVAREINPLIDLDTSADSVETCVTVGKGGRIGTTSIYVSSNGWIARVGAHPLDDPGDSDNPLGAAAAACLAAANVFRHVFRDQLPNASLDRDLTFSAFNYTQTSTPGPTLPDVIDISGTHLVGSGAIGNAFLWTLAAAPRVRGTLPVIDGERIDLGNLQRYVLARDIDANGTTWKADRAADALAQTNVHVIPHNGSWGKYLAATGASHLDRVCVALDTPHDRLAVQAALPRTTLNAWTQVGDLGVSRHTFRGSDACLACVYMPSGTVANEDELVSDALGVPKDLASVLLHTGSAPDDAVLGIIAQHLQVAIDVLAPFRAKPLRTLYHDGICGGLLLKFGAQVGPRAAVTTPLAFQSALAGVMLAAELIAATAGLAQPNVYTATSIDVLRPIGSDLSRRIAKHASGRCLCQDADYIWRYDAKWNA